MKRAAVTQKPAQRVTSTTDVVASVHSKGTHG